jgi:EAL domain-containing protein (putative c-di-GMP-specific phosphodiesterase class I)
MERRHAQRTPSSQSAEVYFQNGSTVHCIIADYCDTGMYIKCDESAFDESHTQQIVRVTFKDPAGKEHFVNAKPAHTSGNAAGIRFVSRYDKAIAALDSRADKAKKEEITPQHKQIIRQCLSMTASRLALEFEQLLPEIEEDFRKAAIEAPSDQEANARMSVADRLEKAKDTISKAFQTALLKEDSLAPVSSDDKDSAESMSLVGKSEFEDWLLSRVLITKLETEFRSQVLPLKMRTDSMSYHSPLASSSPLGPERLVYAFRAALHERTGNAVLERRAFKLLEHKALNLGDDLYKELNDFLESEGIIVNMSRVPIKQEEKAPKTSEPESDDASELEDGAEANTAHSSSKSASTAIENLSPPTNRSYAGRGYAPPLQAENRNLSALDKDQKPENAFRGDSKPEPEHERTASADSETDSPPGQQFAHTEAWTSRATRETFKGVSKLIKSLRKGKEEPLPPGTELFSPQEFETHLSEAHMNVEMRQLESDRLSLLDRVLSSFAEAGNENKALGEEQKSTIDVVDRFFGSLGQNPRLSDSAKQHLFQLEIPVLRQMLSNDAFFSDDESPLRDVLNRIAVLGAKGGRLGRVGQQKITQLITKINEEYDQNKGVVEDVKEELDALISKQHSLYLKNVERVAAAAEGAHKVDQAAKRVKAVVSERVGGRPIPKALQVLLNEGWMEHLKLLLLKHDEDGSEFKEAVAIIDALVSFGNDPQAGFDAKSYVPMIQEGLKQVSGGRDAPKIVREELKQLILDAPTNAHQMVSPDLDSLETKEIDESREQANISRSQELKPWIKRAKSIPINAWLRFNKDDTAQYMRLVWIAKGFTKFVFVNHQGMKVIELGLFKFAGYLKSGEIVPDPDYETPIVKQGLDDMVKDVYDKLAFEASHDQETGLNNKTEFLRTIKKSMQVGERTEPCCIVYLRLLTGTLSDEEEVEVRKPVQTFLQKLEKEGGNVARINRYDFAAFAFGPEVEATVFDWVQEIDRLMAETNDELQSDSVIEYQRAESWGYLGFLNPNSLFSSAIDALARTEVISSGKAKVHTAKVESEVSQEVLESEQLCDFSASDASAFTVFTQPVRRISDRFELPEHMHLQCKKGLQEAFFEPNSPDEEQVLDRWWLGYLARKTSTEEGGQVFRVPLSALSIEKEQFRDELLTLLECTSLNPYAIWFDIYEGCEIANPHAVADIMRELQFYGFRFSLDGFGTPSCPFELLRLLPVDMIVIDPNITIELPQLDEEEDGLDSVVRVAHHFDKAVLAVSIDSAIGLQKVQKRDLDFVQGETVGSYEQAS